MTVRNLGPDGWRITVERDGEEVVVTPDDDLEDVPESAQYFILHLRSALTQSGLGWYRLLSPNNRGLYNQPSLNTNTQNAAASRYLREALKLQAANEFSNQDLRSQVNVLRSELADLRKAFDRLAERLSDGSPSE